MGRCRGWQRVEGGGPENMTVCRMKATAAAVLPQHSSVQRHEASHLREWLLSLGKMLAQLPLVPTRLRRYSRCAQQGGIVIVLLKGQCGKGRGCWVAFHITARVATVC